jgi:hypothetical protein
MIYLVAGLDRSTFARWHDHVMADDVSIATRIARARAAAEGLELIVAAVIGPCSNLVSDGVDASPSASTPRFHGFLRPEAA